MPDDDDPALSVERLEQYGAAIAQARSYLSRSELTREGRLLNALLYSFGYGDAYEMYWTTLNTLEKYPLFMLRPALREAATSAEPGVRLWSVRMLMHQRNPDDLD